MSALLAILLLAACGGAEARPARPPSPALASTPHTEAAVSVDASVDATDAEGAPDATGAEDAAVSALPPLPAATSLPEGVVLRAEPDDHGGAVLVLENHGTRRLRVGAIASAEVYTGEIWLHLENTMISLNAACAEEPECVTLREGESVRAPLWPGTQCPGTQCVCGGSRHVGAGVYRFLAYRCNASEELEGAPFRLAVPAAQSSGAVRDAVDGVGLVVRDE